MRWSRQRIGSERLLNPAWAKRGRPDVVLWDVLPIVDGEVLTVIVESTSTPYRQGVWLRSDQGITVAGQRAPSVELWADTAPNHVVLQCHTSNGGLSVYNIWEHRAVRGSQSESSGMMVTESPNGRRYRCNDFGWEDRFDKLVFRIERQRLRTDGA
jgi:hypothetical protein